MCFHPFKLLNRRKNVFYVHGKKFLQSNCKYKKVLFLEQIVRKNRVDHESTLFWIVKNVHNLGIPDSERAGDVAFGSMDL